MAKITVQNTEITILKLEEQDYISLTDMASAKGNDSRSADVIKNWIRNRYTIEFLGTWEVIHNPDFKVVEFDHFRKSAGLPSFVLSASEWIERTNAIGLAVKKGRYGGTYAHKDIAFEFGSAISVPFKLYLIEEFQRLKTDEYRQLGWSAKRELSKINYLIHTDAIKHNLIPSRDGDTFKERFERGPDRTSLRPIHNAFLKSCNLGERFQLEAQVPYPFTACRLIDNHSDIPSSRLSEQEDHQYGDNPDTLCRGWEHIDER